MTPSPETPSDVTALSTPVSVRTRSMARVMFAAPMVRKSANAARRRGEMTLPPVLLLKRGCRQLAKSRMRCGNGPATSAETRAASDVPRRSVKRGPGDQVAKPGVHCGTTCPGIAFRGPVRARVHACLDGVHVEAQRRACVGGLANLGVVAVDELVDALVQALRRQAQESRRGMRRVPADPGRPPQESASALSQCLTPEDRPLPLRLLCRRGGARCYGLRRTRENRW